MLSRIARNLFELGQQIERAENIARIITVNEKMSVEVEELPEIDLWSPLLAITRTMADYDQQYDEVTKARVINFLMWDDGHPYSVVACLARARQVAKTVRERISEEMWLLLNRVFHESQTLHAQRSQQDFGLKIQEFCNAFYGLAENSMAHGESWHFLQLGVALERAVMTSRILEIKYHILLPSPEDVGKPVDLHQWQTLLRSVSGYGAYRRLYLARIEPANVVNLLLTNIRFPRSIHYCIQRAERALKEIGMRTEEQFLLFRQVQEYIEELRGGLSGQEILASGLMNYLRGLQLKTDELINLVHLAYFNSITVNITDEQQRKLAIQIPQQQQVGYDRA